MTATANDPGAASLSGVHTGRMIILAFAISAAIGALGGIAITPINVDLVSLGRHLRAQRFRRRRLGWLGVEQRSGGGRSRSRASSSRSPPVSCPAGYQDAIAYAILILVLYFRPSGLLGLRSSEGEA